MMLPAIGFAVGGLLGYFRGLQAEHEMIVAMNREFGWVCGTGLETTVAAYTAAFATLAGVLMLVVQALVARRTRRTSDAM